jgi:high-affinity Fe2+/Pb2+ permease
MRNLCWISDSDTWAVVSLIFFAIFCLMFILFLSGRSVALRRTGFFAGIMMLLISLMCLSFSIWQKKDYMKADKAVITRPVVSVKSSPSQDTSKDLFILHEGSKVKLLDSIGDWVNIELADGRQGWIPSVDVETI